LRRSRSFRGFENRIAREHLKATEPPVRAPDGVRTDEPAVVVPAHVDRAKHTSDVLDVEDIGVAVVQENTVFAMLLLLHEGEHLRQGGFSFRFAAEFSDDRTVHRGLPQLVVTERLFADRIFGLAVTVQEPGFEVIAKVADLHRSITLGVNHKPVFGDELTGGCRDDDRRDGLEQVGPGFWCGRLRDLAVGPAGLLAEKLLELLFPLIAVLATEVHNELIERSGCEFAERFAEHGIHGQFPFVLISLYAEEALWAGMVIARRGLFVSRFSL